MAEKIQDFSVLNLGSQSVSAASFVESGDGGLMLTRFERSDFVSDPSDDNDRLGQQRIGTTELAGTLGLKGKSLRYAISSQPVFIRFVKLPPLDEEQVDQIVEFEAQQNVPVPINEVTWNHQLMGTEDDVEVEVMLAAVQSTELADLNGVIQDAGVKVSGVDVAPMALFNAFRFNYPELKDDTTLVIDIGSRTTNLIYCEGGKVFIRMLKVGGADITKAIAKEFKVPFAEADQRKVTDGFVALGGRYADHEDPVIAGISKVIRNTLTRLHSEIMRTTNFYRSQQGGSAPTMALICGGTAGLPFIRDFFAEKLNVPIDFFNPLRNVTFGPGVDTDAVPSRAHLMGELVGLALREVGPCPVEMNLIPEEVQGEKALAKRKPALWACTAVLTIMLAAGGFYYTRAATLTQEVIDSRKSKVDTLTSLDKEIEQWRAKLNEIESRKTPYTRAAFEKTYWIDVLKDLDERMESDAMWITVLEPLANGEPVIGGDQLDLGDSAGGGEPLTVDTIRIGGLYRKNLKGSGVVTDYYDALSNSPYFDFEGKDRNDIIMTLDSGSSGEFAWQWMMELPLPEHARIAFTK